MKQTSLRSIAATAVVVAGSCAFAQTGNMAVNNDGRKPHPSAILDVSSNYLPLATAEQKGMLIPRMTTAQRNAIAPTVAQQGIMVYQTDGVPGFYYYEYGQWVHVDAGADSWDVIGNNPTLVANEFLGTRDNTDFVFRTNNVEAMRVKGTNGARYVGIGTTTPAEAVDVNGALLLNNPSPGSWAPPTSYAATNQVGTILFRPRGIGSPGDTLFSTFVPGAPQNRDAIMWAGHWGNINGTGPQNMAAADANSGGWRKLENDYTERSQKNYQQPGTPTCGPGSVQIPGGITIVAANMTSALASPVREFVSIYPHNTASRIRHQHMYLASELNVEVNQLGGNSTVTGGLCANQPITSLAFYVGAGGATKGVPNNAMAITIKHVSFGVNDLSTGFDISNDPAQSCYVQNTGFTVNRPTVTNNWEVFTPLSQAFVWDGVRNIIVEITYATVPGIVAQPPILFGPSPGGALLTASWNSVSTGAPCANAGAIGSCSFGLAAPGGMPWANALCGVLGTNGGTTQFRPVIQFTGTVATAAPLTSSVSSYLYYQGGFVAESTTTGNPFGRQITPYYAFRGPGTITAENGVFDNSVELNDHVFDRAFDGQVAAKDASRFGTLRITASKRWRSSHG
ncbi:MAG: hypothetical protein U0U25_12000 [Flavobacteriales bacterium]